MRKMPDLRSRLLTAGVLGGCLLAVSCALIAAQRALLPDQKEQPAPALLQSIAALERDLTTMKEGARYRQELRLEELKRLAEKPPASLDRDSAVKMVGISKLFDFFSLNPKHQALAGRPDFQKVHRNLRAEIAAMPRWRSGVHLPETVQPPQPSRKALTVRPREVQVAKLPGPIQSLPIPQPRLGGAATILPPGLQVARIEKIENPDLKAIADRVINVQKLAMHRAVANLADPKRYPLPADHKSFENIFARRLQQVPEARRQAAIAKVMPLLKGAPAERQKVHGELAAIDLTNIQSVAAQAHAVKLRLSPEIIRGDLASSELGRMLRRRSGPQTPPRKKATFGDKIEPGRFDLPGLVQPVPLLRYYNTAYGKHFYTDEFMELGFGRMNWNYEGYAALVYPKQVGETVPLYRYFNSSSLDHFYQLTKGDGYEEIACYVWAEPGPGRVELNRYWSDDEQDHFYIVGRDDAGLAAKGYKFEQVACYVLPYDANSYPWAEASWLDFDVGCMICAKMVHVDSDDLYMGGVAISPTGVTSPLGEFEAGYFYNAGDDAYFPRGRTWITFDLKEGTDWPKTWTIIMAPCVKGEAGDYTEFLQQLVNATKDEVKTYLAEELGAAVGAASGGPVGSVIGLAVGYVVDQGCEWFVKEFFDDIFVPGAVQLTMNGPVVERGDVYVGGTGYWTGHGGEYHIIYFWHARQTEIAYETVEP